MEELTRTKTSSGSCSTPVYYKDNVFTECRHLDKILRRHDADTTSWPKVKLKDAMLYTGATVPKLDVLHPARVHMDFGSGVYLTDDKIAATKYALDRFNDQCFNDKAEGRSPTLYTVVLKDAKMLEFNYDWEKEITLLKNKEFIALLDERIRAAESHDTLAMDSIARTTKAIRYYISNFSPAKSFSMAATPISMDMPNLLSSYYMHKGFDGRIDFVSEPKLGFTTKQFLVFDPSNIEIIGEFDLSDAFSSLLRMEELDSEQLLRPGYFDEILSAILRGR